VATDRLNIRGDLQGQVSLSPEEHPDDRAVRLRTEARRSLIHDWMEVVVFAVVLLAIVAVGAAAAYEGLWDANASPETRHWGQTILSAVMSGGVSFVVGRKVGSK
jgi:hypothetical protein